MAGSKKAVEVLASYVLNAKRAHGEYWMATGGYAGDVWAEAEDEATDLMHEMVDAFYLRGGVYDVDLPREVLMANADARAYDMALDEMAVIRMNRGEGNICLRYLQEVYAKGFGYALEKVQEDVYYRWGVLRERQLGR